MIHRPTDQEVFKILRQHGRVPSIYPYSPALTRQLYLVPSNRALIKLLTGLHSWPISDDFSGTWGVMSDGVHNWTTINGVFAITAGELVHQSGSPGVVRVTESHTETDYYNQAKCAKTAAGDDVGICVRLSNDLLQQYLLRLDGGSNQWQLYRNNSGWTLLDSGAFTATTGTFYTLYLLAEGAGATVTLTYKKDGVALGNSPLADTSASRITAANYPGLRCGGGQVGGKYDDFIADLLAGGPTGPPTGSWMMMGCGV